jgi:GNAT superfamily N-acetyltransferase
MFSINVLRDEDGAWALHAIGTGGVCIGAMRLRRWSECYCIGVAFGLFVDESHRRKRVANTLMLRAEEVARLNGISLLLSTIRVDNPASIALVTMRGWASLIGEVRNPKSGNDLRVYAKSIADAVFPPAVPAKDAL